MYLIVRQSILGAWEIIAAVEGIRECQNWMTSHADDNVLVVEAFKGRSIRLAHP
jgi:hypothetical protein